MQLRSVGRSSLQVSLAGLGTSNFGGRVEPRMARAIIHKALDLGVTLFDTADSYGDGRCEEVLAEALGARRKEVIIASKWGNFDPGGGAPKPAVEIRGGSRWYVLHALEQSLRRLATDYIDLYQLHKPDLQTPIEETLQALNHAIRQGKVRHIGVSNMPAWQIVEAQLIAKQLGIDGFVSFQDRYSLLARGIETTVFPATDRYGLGLLPNLPLAEGLLTGKYQRQTPAPEGTRLATWSRMTERSVNERNWSVMEQLRSFAFERGHALLELAMSWLATRPQVSSIIAGATRPEQVEQNISALGWALTEDELSAIDRITLESH
ncbi:MAG: aldo/keto reductase [Pseudomonadota bacterium]